MMLLAFVSIFGQPKAKSQKPKAMLNKAFFKFKKEAFSFSKDNPNKTKITSHRSQNKVFMKASILSFFFSKL